MIVGLCGSIAVVPALSLASSSASGATRHPVQPGSPPRDPQSSGLPGSEAVAALLLADAALLSAGGAGGVPSLATGRSAAITTSVPLSAPPTAGAAVLGAAVLGAAGAAALGAAARGAPASASPSASPSPSALAPAPVSGAAVVTATDARVDTARETTAPSVTVRVNPSYSRDKAGVASWLDTIPAGTCANNDAPMGSTIKVTNAAGVSITCKVVSTGPFVAGRVVDLAKSTFAQLSPVSQGLVGVAVSW